MKAFFTTIIYQPLLNALVWLYAVIPGNDTGVAIIVLTILIKLALYPLSASSIKAQRAMTRLQPKIEALKARYKDDKQALAQETMKLYKENKVSPFSSCLPMLIQLPVLLGLYWVFLAGLRGEDFHLLYSFVSNPGVLNPIAFGFFDMIEPSVWLAVGAGIAQFFQARMLNRQRPVVKSDGAKDESMMANMNKQMMYFMPVLTVIIGMKLPGGLALYWLVTTLLTILQQHIVFRKLKQEESEGIVIE